MSNSLANALGMQVQAPAAPMNGMMNPMSGMMNMMTQFDQFRRSFTGNPEQSFRQLMSSGKISQEQYNNLAQQASQFVQCMKMMGRYYGC